MLEQDQARDLGQQVLKRCGKDPAEVVIIHKDHALTRFANNTIHQNVAELNNTVYLRLMQGKRKGMASSNRLDAAALDELVAHARANAAASSEDPDFPGFAEASSYLPVPANDQDTANLSPEARADSVAVVCRLADEKGLNASGAFSSGANAFCVANSYSLFAYHSISEADFQTVVMSADSSGRAQASSWKVADIDPESIGREAINKAMLGRNPRDIEPGDFPVVLDPYVTEDLLNMLNMYGMGGQAVLDGRSWMNDRLGDQLMSPEVNIWDDGQDPDGMPVPFDAEGVPKQKVDIVSQGVATRPVHDRSTAAKADAESTGHAIPPYFPPFMHAIGPIGLNLFMEPGSTSLEDMISSTKKGLYITRFWYTRLVHPRDCVVTGMTRDGVFMVEQGEIAYPVKNLRFTQSYVDALANVESIGNETCLLKSEYGSHAKCVPAIKLGGFNFTGATV
jgi:predicted Zn-dependent protease